MSDYTSIEAFNAALAAAKVQLPARLMTPVAVAGNKLALRIKVRVTETGRNMEDEPFTPYSRHHKYKKTKYGKGDLGKQIAFKNFYFQNRFWPTFGVKKTELKNEIITSTINFSGQNRKISNMKLNAIHSEFEGNGEESEFGIAYPNEAEEAKLVEAIEMSVYEILGELL